jgi:type IV pilus assembly protein PilF
MKNFLFHFAAALACAAVLPGCVSQTSVHGQAVNEPAAFDAVRRAQVHNELSGAYYQRGQMAVALDEANKALKEFTNYVPALSMQGLIYMELGENEKATASFEQALSLAPADSEVLNNFGWFVCQRGDPGKAMGLFQAALKNPLYTTPERAYLNAGLCARKLGNEAEAETHFLQALKRQPQLGSALYNMADLAYKRANTKEAESFLARYNRATGNPTVDALLLGVKVSRALGDDNSLQSYVQQLKRRFPEAPQTRQAEESR